MSDEKSLQREWITAQIAQRGLKLTGEIEDVQITPSATVLSVMTDSGKVYFKAPMPAFAFEAPLTAKLAEWFPVDLPVVLGMDAARGWLLLRDAGVRVRDLIRADGDGSRWDEYLRRYVALQQATASRVDELLALGVPDRRLKKLPRLYDALLLDTAILLVGQKYGVSDAQFAELQGYLSTLQTLCDQLATYNIPQTLHHDDFHTGNTMVQANTPTFIDWGESCIAHPFYSLVIVLRDAKFTLKQDQATLDHLTDVYLRCWIAYEPMERLKEAFVVAAQLAALCRTLTWYRVVSNLPEDARTEYADAVPYWLVTFLKNTPFEA